MPREIKKTQIKYEDKRPEDLGSKQERQRSRDRDLTVKKEEKQQNLKEVKIDPKSRRARLEALKKARQQQTKTEEAKDLTGNSNMMQPEIIIIKDNPSNLNTVDNCNQSPKQIISLSKSSDIHQQSQNESLQKPSEANFKAQVKKEQLDPHILQNKNDQESDQQSLQEQDGPQKRVLLKPVFLSKADRAKQQQEEQRQREDERKRKNLRYTTKLLLEENKGSDEESENDNVIDLDDDETNLPDDSDDKNQEMEYELWKIRELKRIRRDRDRRQKHTLQKAELERRRQMNNEEILLENRLLGSDATENSTETKYVYMQKYYHKGAFYQDSNDPIFQRDYNLPTPMEMQDKSSLPQILQKRNGNFGKKGQSKYTHLNAEDTTDNNPLTRPDESLLNNWKKKTAGYKR